MSFHGQSYWYEAGGKRLEIGVCQGLGGDVWLVGWQRGGATKRLKSPRLEPSDNPDALQEALDEWAAEKGLDAVQASAPSETTAVEPVVSVGALRAGDALPATGLFERDPANDREATEWIQERIDRGRRTALEIAVLIAHVRTYYYREDAAGWLTWAQEEFGYGRRFCFQCLSAGTLVQRVHHGALIECDIQKLEALAAIPPEQLATLLEHWDPSQASRDEVRKKVAMWKAAPVKCEQCGAEFDADGDETVCPACAGAQARRGAKSGDKPQGDPWERYIEKIAGMSDEKAREVAAQTGAGIAFRAAFRLLDLAMYHVAEYKDLTPELLATWRGDLDAATAGFDRLARETAMPTAKGSRT